MTIEVQQRVHGEVPHRDVAHPTNPKVSLLAGEFYAEDPHPHFAWMRRHAPVYWDQQWGVWGITRYDDIAEISRRPELFSNAQGMRPDSPPMPMMIDMDDPAHKRRRNLVNRGFTRGRVQGLEPRIREVCVELIEAARQKREFDFIWDLAAWLPLVMIGDMLGVAKDDLRFLLDISDDLQRAVSATATPAAHEKAAHAFMTYQEYAHKVIRERRGSGSVEDLMGILAHGELDGDRLTDDEITMESLLILIGGDETTRHVISGGMYQLLKHPDQRQILIDDPSKIPSGVEEMLRWVSPIQNMARTVTADTELRGQQLRAGDKLLLLYPSGNRDEAVFEDPFRFDVERTPNFHIAFGGNGPHFCLGASLARLELRVMFEECLRRMPALALQNDDPLPVRPANFIAGFEAMPVRV